MNFSTHSRKEFTCPNCKSDFSIKSFRAPMKPYAIETDFREYSGINDFLPYDIKNCPKCLYCDYTFKNINISNDLRKILNERKHLYQLPTSKIVPSTKYYIKGFLLQQSRVSSFDSAWEFLKASWMARREVDPKLEAFYQELTIRELMAFLKTSPLSNTLYDKSLYILGELHRRTKDFNQAYKCLINLKTNQFYEEVVKQLLILIDSKFDGISFFPNMELSAIELMTIYNDFSFLNDCNSILIEDEVKHEFQLNQRSIA